MDWINIFCELSNKNKNIDNKAVKTEYIEQIKQIQKEKVNEIKQEHEESKTVKQNIAKEKATKYEEIKNGVSNKICMNNNEISHAKGSEKQTLNNHKGQKDSFERVRSSKVMKQNEGDLDEAHETMPRSNFLAIDQLKEYVPLHNRVNTSPSKSHNSFQSDLRGAGSKRQQPSGLTSDRNSNLSPDSSAKKIVKAEDDDQHDLEKDQIGISNDQSLSGCRLRATHSNKSDTTTKSEAKSTSKRDMKKDVTDQSTKFKENS